MGVPSISESQAEAYPPDRVRSLALMDKKFRYEFFTFGGGLRRCRYAFASTK